jgi:hypothetical protein
MKFYLDTEFIEAGPYRPVQLISIGLVSEKGSTLYAESSEFNSADASEWVLDNVLPHLGNPESREKLASIGERIKWFVNGENEGKIEFWGYYADYDWVVFCQIFGTMMDLPKGFPMYCRDIKQLCDSLGNPKLPEQSSTEHNALNDALWNKTAHEFLNERGRH